MLILQIQKRLSNCLQKFFWIDNKLLYLSIGLILYPIFDLKQKIIKFSYPFVVLFWEHLRCCFKQINVSICINALYYLMLFVFFGNLFNDILNGQHPFLLEYLFFGSKINVLKSVEYCKPIASFIAFFYRGNLQRNFVFYFSSFWVLNYKGLVLKDHVVVVPCSYANNTLEYLYITLHYNLLKWLKLKM